MKCLLKQDFLVVFRLTELVMHPLGAKPRWLELAHFCPVA